MRRSRILLMVSLSGRRKNRRHTADVSVLALSWYHVLAHTRREVLESPHTAENAGIVWLTHSSLGVSFELRLVGRAKQLHLKAYSRASDQKVSVPALSRWRAEEGGFIRSGTSQRVGKRTRRGKRILADKGTPRGGQRNAVLEPCCCNNGGSPP